MWEGGPASALDHAKAHFAGTRRCWPAIESANGPQPRPRSYSRPIWTTAGKDRSGFRTVNNRNNSTSARSYSGLPITSIRAMRGWAMRNKVDLIVVGEGLAGVTAAAAAAREGLQVMLVSTGPGKFVLGTCCIDVAGLTGAELGGSEYSRENLM